MTEEKFFPHLRIGEKNISRTRNMSEEKKVIRRHLEVDSIV